MRCTKDIVDHCSANAEYISKISELSHRFDWPNFIVALAVAIFAAISAVSARNANRSSRVQANREYFDKVCGDGFYTALKLFHKTLESIKSSSLSSQSLQENLQQIKNLTKELLTGSLYTECMNIDKVATAHDSTRLQETYNSVEDRLTAILGCLEQDAEKVHLRLQELIDALTKDLSVLNQEYLGLRNAYKP